MLRTCLLLAKAPVSWNSTSQSTMALSTIEALYMAVIEVVKEAIWLQGLPDKLEVRKKNVRVHCDSQIGIHFAKK
mgnify:CR=1 FL=1